MLWTGQSEARIAEGAKDFVLSLPSLGPTLTHIQWALVLFPGDKEAGQ